MTKIITGSVVSVGLHKTEVSIDPYGLNPLAEDARQVITIHPKTPPPKLFTGGTADLPLFTASGLDPQILLRLPWMCRHYAAAISDPAVLHSIFEQISDQPNAAMPHAGLDEAIGRMQRWCLDIGEAA